MIEGGLFVQLDKFSTVEISLDREAGVGCGGNDITHFPDSVSLYMRQENMKRITGMAGATGDENATGTAQRSAGPSDSYGGRIRGRIKPNITFTEDIASNAPAEVEVRCAPDGTIVGKKLIKSSGNAAWDNAVLKAIDKTEILPRDIDGRIHSPLVISFRPKD